jgi:hypothetical protein
LYAPKNWVTINAQNDFRCDLSNQPPPLDLCQRAASNLHYLKHFWKDNDFLTPAEGSVGLGFADGELLGISRAAEFGIGTGIFWSGTLLGSIQTTNRWRTKKAGGTEAISTPKVIALLLFRHTFPLNIGRRHRVVLGEHRHDVLAAAFLVPASRPIITATHIRANRQGWEQARKGDKEDFFHRARPTIYTRMNFISIKYRKCPF